MSSQISFLPRLASPSNHLPLTLISLEEWVMVKLHGVDTVNYLQGQLTCDVVNLRKNQYSFGAHCNAKGKMFSNMCVFHFREGMAFIERRNVLINQLTALKKYAIFFKTTITADDQEVMIGVAGFQAKEALSKLFDTLPNATQTIEHHQETTLLHFSFPAERFLLITTQEVYENLLKTLKGQVQFNNSCQWLAMDIEAGYPLIDQATSEKFIPQETNIQALKGISFDKGCYLGQEIVARTKYRSINKRALYCLVGQTKHIPQAGDNLEVKVGENWRPTGTVLAACQLKNGIVWVQAVLNKHLSIDDQLRVRGDKISALTFHPLPYTLNE